MGVKLMPTTEEYLRELGELRRDLPKVQNEMELQQMLMLYLEVEAEFYSLVKVEAIAC